VQLGGTREIIRRQRHKRLSHGGLRRLTGKLSASCGQFSVVVRSQHGSLAPWLRRAKDSQRRLISHDHSMPRARRVIWMPLCRVEGVVGSRSAAKTLVRLNVASRVRHETQLKQSLGRRSHISRDQFEASYLTDGRQMGEAAQRPPSYTQGASRMLSARSAAEM